MAIVAPVDNGKINTQLYETEATKKKEAGDGLGKDAFLQLLVAQMQYQDPLEPMDNTQYVSQLATFSQLESMQNVEASLTSGQAANLVGKAVIVKSTSEVTGETSLVSGIVDYVVYENGSAFLVINEEKYPYEDLDTVISDDYITKMSDMEMARTVVNYIEELPEVADANLAFADKVKKAREAYDSLTASQKAFIGEDYTNKLKELEDLMAKLNNSGKA